MPVVRRPISILVPRVAIVSIRSIRAIWLGIALSVAACAHAPADASVRAPSDDVQSRLARENAALRRRLQMLEDRVLNLEQAGRGGAPAAASAHNSAYSLPDGRRLPVVKADEPRAPVRVRAKTLQRPPPAEDPDAMYDDMGSDDDVAGFRPPEPAAPTSPPEEVDDMGRSYRLVGSRLVDLTKKNAPTRPDRPDRGRKGAPVVAEYDAAMTVYKTGAFADAERAFESFARSHPGHDYADNALYWKGEAAYDQAHYADALAAFTEVVERYGGGNKAADALLKIGLCYRQLGDEDNARDVLTQLVSAYPGERASDIARAKLAEFGI
jgi:tol-pal system protein YbgF